MMRLAQECDSVKKRIVQVLASDLSDGAKIAAIATLVGAATSAHEVANLTHRSLRTVERHYAEMRTCGYADLRSRSTQKCVPADTQICGSPLDKKKGLPRTPSKEKTQPLPTGLADGEPNSINVGASGKVAAAADFSEKRRQRVIAGLSEILQATIPCADKAKNFATEQIELNGLKVVEQAYGLLKARMASGETFAKPAVILARICADVRREMDREAEDEWTGPLLPPWELPKTLSEKQREVREKAYYRAQGFTMGRG